MILARKEEHELYHLAEDPGEQIDLFREKREVAARMMDIIRRRRAENTEQSKHYEGSITTFDKDRLEQLRALGYID